MFLEVSSLNLTVKALEIVEVLLFCIEFFRLFFNFLFYFSLPDWLPVILFNRLSAEAKILC